MGWTKASAKKAAATRAKNRLEAARRAGAIEVKTLFTPTSDAVFKVSLEPEPTPTDDGATVTMDELRRDLATVIRTLQAVRPKPTNENPLVFDRALSVWTIMELTR